MTRRKEQTVRIPISEYQKLTNKLEEIMFEALKKKYLQDYIGLTSPDSKLSLDTKTYFEREYKSLDFPPLFKKVLDETIKAIRWEDVDVAINGYISTYVKEKSELEAKYV